jgi:dTDP-4-amino-4,6-dideoxygalactose transaminase
MIRLSKSTISDDEKTAVKKVLDKEFLGMGEEVLEFEKALSDYFGRKSLCVVNGTAALHLACQAVGIGPGDEVLVQSITYVASFQAISACGAKPISCDIQEKTLTIDLNDAKHRITENTKAIMPVHYAGGVGNIEEVYEFAKKYNLRVIEDAAHAFGTQHKKKKVGSFGDIVCFSFDGIKNITSGEGGCIVTDDKEALRIISDARLLGVQKDSEMRYAGKRSWEFTVGAQGWRYHMSNIMAAIGKVQLEKFDLMSKKRKNLSKAYNNHFIGNKVIKPIQIDLDNVVPHIYVVRIKGLTDRKRLQDKMFQYGIQTGYHYQPNHWLDFFKFKGHEDLPMTDKIFPELLTLPLHYDLQEKDIDYVATTLINFVNTN